MKFRKKLASNTKPMEKSYEASLQERTAALYKPITSVSSTAAMFSEIRHTDEIEAELDKRLESTRWLIRYSRSLALHALRLIILDTKPEKESKGIQALSKSQRLPVPLHAQETWTQESPPRPQYSRTGEKPTDTKPATVPDHTKSLNTHFLDTTAIPYMKTWRRLTYWQITISGITVHNASSPCRFDIGTSIYLNFESTVSWLDCYFVFKYQYRTGSCDFDLASWLQRSRLLLYITSLVEYNSGRKFRVTTRNPYRVRTHRIRIWCCFFQSLGNVCCDVTWVSPRSTLCSFVSVSSCFHSPNIIPLLPLHPMDPLSKDSIETADHFIYVTQVYFCGTYSFHLTSPLGTHPRIL